MKIKIDRKADAAYAYLKSRSNKIKRTISLNDFTNLDLDKKGGIVGIELLYITETLPQEAIRSERALEAYLLDLPLPN